MAERLSRKAPYDLVWSEPIKTLAARFGISDISLKNKCARILPLSGVNPNGKLWSISVMPGAIPMSLNSNTTSLECL